jgi:acyl-CoA synthetase (AMP-forming)/AMP-acid ligase II
MITAQYQTLPEPLIERARTESRRRLLTLLGDDGTPEHLSATDLYDAARSSARGLQQAGIASGDVVAIAIGPLRPLIETFIGALYRGAIPVITSWGYDRLDEAHAARVASLLHRSGARAVISAGERTALLERLAGDIPVLAAERLPVGDDVREHDLCGRRSTDDVAYLQFSSGTAGAQKGIPHTHRRVLRFLEAKRQSVGRVLQPDDIIVSWLPLYHDFGLVSGLLTPLVLGIYAVLMSAHRWVRDPKILFHALHEYGGTLTYMPNFALSHCARAIRDRDLDGIDLGRVQELVTGAEPVRPGSLDAFAERFARYNFPRAALRAGYGMAEMVEGVSVTPAGRPPNVDWIDRESLERGRTASPVPAEHPQAVAVVSCGVPMMGVKLRIIGERGEDLHERAVGEILIQADHMFTGYHDAAELTDAPLRDGWFASGDLGYVAAGELYITGRKSDLIIVGGRKFQPEEFEHVADSIAGLAPGRSVAFGIFDEARGCDRIVMVCELSAPADAEQQVAIARQLRAQIVHQIGTALGELQLVPRGWVRKTSSGKTSRPENRRKYLEQRAGEPRP